jgi:hypothetical protein
MSLAGHNGGPSLAPGVAWRTHCWRQARAALLPRLPIEVVRLRVRRAAELGLDYRTYAGVRASTGHDIVAFLFSTNALRLLRDGQRLDAARAAKIVAISGVARLVATQPPLKPATLLVDLGAQDVAFDAATHAPGLADNWAATRRHLVGFLAANRHPADQVLVIGDTSLERGWSEAARMAGFLAADCYFAGGRGLRRPLAKLAGLGYGRGG